MNSSKRVLISAIVRKALMDCVVANNGSCTSSEEPEQLFNSPQATAIKEEIVKAGRKLWERQYVDGNGGNISARLSPKFFLCTPTLCSKGDLRVDDLSLVDLENRLICGTKAQTSEILLHLEIYKAVPSAQAVIHCHPPYATAHAIAGVVPQGNLVPEQEVFVGPVVLTPYETPGTMEFARTVLPVVKQHNTILLANHGIVCWADTVTHAEWYVEVIETYCKTVMIASQLKSPLPEIPSNKIPDLLAMKKKLGLPDPRLPQETDAISDGIAEMANAALSQGAFVHERGSSSSRLNGEQIDQLVSALTEQILGFIKKSA
jgi:L-fuculose-phosphate aldolase